MEVVRKLHFFPAVFMKSDRRVDRRKRRLRPLLEYLEPEKRIGFLFSILWEASGRYAFPYFMLLIPLASGAAGTIMETAENIVLSKIKKKDGRTDGKSC